MICGPPEAPDSVWRPPREVRVGDSSRQNGHYSKPRNKPDGPGLLLGTNLGVKGIQAAGRHPQDPSPLRGTLGSSLKSPAEGARHGVSREVPCSALKGETVPDSLPATPKGPPTRRVPQRGTSRVPAPLPLSPFSPPDRDRRGDSPAWSGRGSRPSRRTSG